MRSIKILGIMVIVFTSCAVLTPQETQQARERLIEAYNEARERHNPEKVKKTVKDLLVGKWQYVGLEVEADNLTAVQRVDSPSKQLSRALDEVIKSATAEQVKLPDTLGQTETSNASDPAGNEQASAEGTTRLPRIEVTDEKSEQQILAAKVALVASTRQNLTLEFFEDHGSYHYHGNNSGKTVTGQCYVTTKRYGDDPFPFIRFNQRTGPEMLGFLFGSEPVRQIAAKQKQKRVTILRNRKISNRRAQAAALKQSGFSIASTMAGITVTEDTLYLILYRDMELTPKGWKGMGRLRCTFKRIE